MALPGLQRATKHSFTLPAEPWRDVAELKLEISIAPPPMLKPGSPPPAEAIVLYVFDPEPVLFGAAALHCYAGCGYFTSGRGAEAAFQRLYVVGIGHDPSEFAAGPNGWDGPALRNLRRRDLPPLTHPALTPGQARVPNPAAQRLATALASTVFPHIETELLGLGGRPQVRAALGASYTAVLALQVLLHAPSALDAYVLGSPSVPFDPEILDWLRAAKPDPPRPVGGSIASAATASAATASAADSADVSAADADAVRSAAAAPPAGAFIAYGALEREEPPPAAEASGRKAVPLTRNAANVHRGIPDYSHALASLLRERGLEVDGAHEIEREDHTSLKLTLVSQGVSWLMQYIARHYGAAQGRTDAEKAAGVTALEKAAASVKLS